MVAEPTVEMTAPPLETIWPPALLVIETAPLPLATIAPVAPPRTRPELLSVRLDVPPVVIATGPLIWAPAALLISSRPP